MLLEYPYSTPSDVLSVGDRCKGNAYGLDNGLDNGDDGLAAASPPLPSLPPPLPPPPLLLLLFRLTVNRTSSTALATNSAACLGSLTGVPFTAITSAPSNVDDELSLLSLLALASTPERPCRENILSGNIREIMAISGCWREERVKTIPTFAFGRLKAVSVVIPDSDNADDASVLFLLLVLLLGWMERV